MLKLTIRPTVFCVRNFNQHGQAVRTLTTRDINIAEAHLERMKELQTRYAPDYDLFRFVLSVETATADNQHLFGEEKVPE